jgi:hypothetical protein
MVLSQLGKGEVPSKTGVVVVDNRSYGTLNLALYRQGCHFKWHFLHIKRPTM